MSPRKTRARTRAAQPVDVEFTDSDNDDASYAAPPPKRRATTKSRTRARATSQVAKLGAKSGGLELMTRLPLDVLYEIFRMLHPRDLLALSRTTKAVRAVLLNRSATSVWLFAMDAVNDGDAQDGGEVFRLPPCPDNLVIPQYASLVFDTFCNHCGKDNARIQHFGLQIRLCSACSKEQLVAPFDFLMSIGMSFENAGVLAPIFPVNVCEDSPYYELSYIPKMERIFEALAAVPPEQIYAYVDEAIQRVEVLTNHSLQCMVWYDYQRARRTQELDNLRNERMQKIEERLRALGWGHEIDFGEELISQHSLVNKPQALTERVWRNIEPELMNMMEEIRTRRKIDDLTTTRKILNACLHDGWARRISVYPVMPGIGDIVCTDFFPKLEPMVYNGDLRYAPDEELHVFEDAALETLPDALKAWHRYLGLLLYDWIARGESGLQLQLGDDKSEDEKIAWLNLATTTFYCRNDSCSTAHLNAPRSFRYPYILSHKCQLATHTFDFMRCEPWTPQGLEYDHDRVNVLTDIVRAAGLDPGSATVEDLDELDARFVDKYRLDQLQRDGHGSGAHFMSWWSCVSV
ncbi:hypothetical protein EXIGLDRAFT_831452 [Exidia glandulosa HHB12029]|uniref:F-box domain-containing protein n=1 Tax=Exidia glandulosa HHB12029 TaxID=1314781 RepID=A0A165MN58_EXIGL|nr:hypothetical protein EXIGLDRAFT_831452 [Exidia glandulosa HHB12029]